MIKTLCLYSRSQTQKSLIFILSFIEVKLEYPTHLPLLPFGLPTIALDTHIDHVSNRTTFAMDTNVAEVEQKLLEVVAAILWMIFSMLVFILFILIFLRLQKSCIKIGYLPFFFSTMFNEYSNNSLHFFF